MFTVVIRQYLLARGISRGGLTASQGIFEDLLEAQELQDGEINSWVKTKTTLVWTEGRVELHAVSAVDLWESLVIFPDDAELDDALWNGDDLEGGLEFGILFKESAVFEG